MAVDLKIDVDDLTKGTSAFEQKVLAAIGMYASTQAQDLRSYMQSNRPWTDQTGDAKKFLNTMVSQIPGGYRITLAHGVDYGIWLELANNKNYAIVGPTRDLKGPEVLQGMQDLLSKV